MQKSPRGFFLTLAALWLLLCIAAYVYSQQKNIPGWVVYAVVPAFLVEAGFYVATGFEAIRKRFEQSSQVHLATAATLSGAAPYAIYSIGTGIFDFRSFAALLVLAALPSFWYVVLGRRTAADIGFLGLMALPVIAGLFKVIYADPFPRLQLHVLGLLMWYRLGILAVLSLRRMEGIGFGFVPRRSDWGIGFRNYLLFLPIGYFAALGLNFIRPDPVDITLRTAALALATFVVTLWVLALAEEFFFRGLLQQMLARKLKGNVVAIAIASALFGAAHLGFRDFPNWRFALLATAAGVFYGRAYSQAQSIRAPMVTHALVVTTWRVFLA